MRLGLSCLSFMGKPPTYTRNVSTRVLVDDSHGEMGGIMADGHAKQNDLQRRQQQLKQQHAIVPAGMFVQATICVG